MHWRQQQQPAAASSSSNGGSGSGSLAQQPQGRSSRRRHRRRAQLLQAAHTTQGLAVKFQKEGTKGLLAVVRTAEGTGRWAAAGGGRRRRAAAGGGRRRKVAGAALPPPPLFSSVDRMSMVGCRCEIRASRVGRTGVARQPGPAGRGLPRPPTAWTPLGTRSALPKVAVLHRLPSKRHGEQAAAHLPRPGAPLLLATKHSS